MNSFSVKFVRLILGKFAKGSEHLKIDSLYFSNKLCMTSVVK